jgi:hypothetical protein
VQGIGKNEMAYSETAIILPEVIATAGIKFIDTDTV